MRQIFFLLLALLVLQLFFPAVTGKLEQAALTFLDMANAVLTSAAASAGNAPPL